MSTRLVLATAWPCRRRRPSLRWRLCARAVWAGAPRGVRRRFAARLLRAKICVSWQLSAVVQRQPSARAATFCVPILPKKTRVACGSLRHTAPHGVTYLSIESPRPSRRSYGVCRNQNAGTAGPPRGPPRPQERNRSLGKLPKALLRLVYGSALSVWTASTWPPGFELGFRKAANAACQTRGSRCNSSVSRSDAAANNDQH